MLLDPAHPAPAGTRILAPPAGVPFVDLAREHAPLEDALAAAFARVVASSGFILGAEVEAFEDAWAAFCGTSDAVGVASGTAALTLALQAGGVQPGDEVIVPAHTFVASALAVIHAGAVPVLCDVDEARGLIDPASAACAVGARTTAIVAVHLYGQPAPMRELRTLSSRHGLLLVEDAAQAHGAELDGRRAGALGDVAAFSFYPSKNLGALGDGGAITTARADIAARARGLRNLGQLVKGEHSVLGWNERLDGLQAALLRVKLPHLDRNNRRRRSRAADYRRLLPRVRALPERSDALDVFHLYPIRVADPRALARRLARAGVDTGVHYSPSLADQPPVAARARRPVPLDRSLAWAREELSLPMFAGLTLAEAERVSDAVLSTDESHSDAGKEAS